MRAGWSVGAVFLAAVTCGCGGPDGPPADAVFVNGNIYTLAGAPPERLEDEPRVTALAVRGGRIVATGDDAAIRRRAGGGTRVHDLAGAAVFPGFVDAHVHMHSLGRSLRELDFVGTTSYEEVVARVRERAASLPAGDWILGRGWDQNDWPDTAFPDHAALSAASPEHPVYLRRIDGHAALVNARALERAGITAATPDPPGGRIVRRPDGAPAGVLVDAAVGLVTQHLPPPSESERRLRLRLALEHALRAGLTGVHDAGVGLAELEDYRALLASGELPLRAYVMLDGTPDRADADVFQQALEVGPQPFDATRHLAVGAVKLMLDGALGSRGAALLSPYSDAPETHGLPQYTPEDFLAAARPLHGKGYQIAVHCIGDAANRLALDTFERLQAESPRPQARHRIEHAQVIAPEDIARFAALGVLPSMQPTHCTSDMPWAGTRLGSERLRGAYAWRSLRATGVVIPAGSDAPVESIEPLRGIYAAVTRQDEHGSPAEGWSPEERLTRSEALRAFTAWAAYASFTEGDLGTLEVGKLADFVVLDRDIARVPAPENLLARVLATVVGGAQVHAAAP